MKQLRLRSYQQEAIAAIDASFERGILRPAVVLSTGLGKTVVFAHLVGREVERGKRALVLVHRDELAQQAVDKIRSASPGIDVGVVKAEQNDVGAAVVVASVQTLARQHRIEQFAVDAFGVVIADECFPAGTLVGGVPIEQIKVGDLVRSWDEETGREVLRRVTRTMKKTPESMVRVTFENGEQVCCTPNHPFMTSEGWVPAALLHGESVVSFTHHADATTHLMHSVLRSSSSDGEEEDRRLAAVGPNVLLTGTSGRVGQPGRLRADGTDEPPARLATDDRTEPDAPTGATREDAGDAEADPAPASYARWERFARTGAPASSRGVPGLANGGDDRSGGRRAPVPLQRGHRAPLDAGLRGGGRGVPFRAGPPSLRPATGRAVVARRVVDVSVLESGGDGTYGGVCRDGAVYNLEVEGTHTYLIEDGIVVHNCHHATAKTWVEVLTYFGCFGYDSSYMTPVGPVIDAWATRAVGFTATMHRDDGAGLGNVWEEVVYERDTEWAIEHGFLTDVRGQQVTIDGFDLAQIAKSRGDYQEGKLGDALVSIGAGDVVARAYWEHAGIAGSDPGGAFDTTRKGVLFAPTVGSAYHFAEAFEDAGIPSAVIEGTMSREDRALVYKRYDEGEIRVLHNCMVLTEGWDSPSTEVCVVARPTQNPGLYQQMLGRVLRPFPGKNEALVLDVVGIAGQHRLQSLTSLTKVQILPGESLVEAQERAVREQAEAGEREKITKSHQAREVELFAASHSTWLQTKAGVWFIPVRVKDKNAHVILWENGAGTWNVGLKVVGRQGEWLHKGLTFEYALSWGEQTADEIDPTLAEKGRAWRRTKPSDKQLELALRYKVAPIDELTTMRKGAVSDLLSVHVASRDLDKILGKN